MTSDQDCNLLVMNRFEIRLSGSLLLEPPSLPFLAARMLKTVIVKDFGSKPTSTIFARNCLPKRASRLQSNPLQKCESRQVYVLAFVAIFMANFPRSLLTPLSIIFASAAYNIVESTDNVGKNVTQLNLGCTSSLTSNHPSKDYKSETN